MREGRRRARTDASFIPATDRVSSPQLEVPTIIPEERRRRKWDKNGK